MAKAADFKDGNLALDIGTGTSLAAICAINQTFPKQKIRIIGVDLSSKMLQKARRNLKRFQIRNHVLNINCDARHLPLRKSLLDRVISVYGIGGVKTRLRKLFLELLHVSKKESLFSLGEMTSPPKEKSLFQRKLHELLIEPCINLVWQFKDLNLSAIFKMFNIKIIKKKYYDTNYLGSMTLLVGKLRKNQNN